ncbi:MAG: hypothetical protein IPK01_07895 [Acidobacteria bacterium]|nr:hypothetical protein [Acidobacteriota bacterium]
MKRILALALVMMFCSVIAFSDIARPDQKPDRTPKVLYNATADMSITLDRNASRPVLRIPKTTLKYLRAELEAADDSADDTAAVTTGGGSNWTKTQTIISGAFLSLAFVFGGFWFIRSGKASSKGVRNLVVVGVMSGIAVTATYVYANVGPPPVSGITNKIFNRSAMFGGDYAHERNIRVEKTDGDEIELIIPDPQPAANTEKIIKISPANNE